VGRYFVAVRPTAAVRAELEEIPTAEFGGVRWTRPDQWHVTLAFLGDVDESEAVGALERVDHPSVPVGLGPKVGLLGTNAVVVPATGLDELAAVVRAEFGSIAPELASREFRGHLTLARARSDPPPGLVGRAVAASFEAAELELIASHLDHHGAHHRTVARHRLGL
jgi:RNA 2',3'-cyclic 3'-phosphodiesterase